MIKFPYIFSCFLNNFDCQKIKKNVAVLQVSLYSLPQMTPDLTLIELVKSYDSGEITRSEFQKRVRALPTALILRVADILTESPGYSSKHCLANEPAGSVSAGELISHLGNRF